MFNPEEKFGRNQVAVSYIEERRRQVEDYRKKKRMNNCSIISPEEMFDEAILIIEQTTTLYPTALGTSSLNIPARTFFDSKDKLLHALKRLKKQTLEDVKSGLLTPDEANVISAQTSELVIAGDTDTFIRETNQYVRVKDTPIWQRLIALVVGAILGFFSGLIMGAAAGPGAVLTALSGGAAGAVAGSLTGIGLITIFKKPQPQPITDVASLSKEIFKDDVQSLMLLM